MRTLMTSAGTVIANDKLMPACKNGGNVTGPALKRMLRQSCSRERCTSQHTNRAGWYAPCSQCEQKLKQCKSEVLAKRENGSYFWRKTNGWDLRKIEVSILAVSSGTADRGSCGASWWWRKVVRGLKAHPHLYTNVNEACGTEANANECQNVACSVFAAQANEQEFHWLFIGCPNKCMSTSVWLRTYFSLKYRLLTDSIRLFAA